MVPQKSGLWLGKKIRSPWFQNRCSRTSKLSGKVDSPSALHLVSRGTSVRSIFEMRSNSLPPNAPERMTDYKTAAEDLRGNPGQWRAYESPSNCVILAGPGSGKTKTLTTKMARMLAEDVQRPSGIACITYNTECARELQKRLATLGVVESSNVFIGTVHSFSLKHVVSPFAWLSDLGFPKEISVASVSDIDR